MNSVVKEEGEELEYNGWCGWCWGLLVEGYYGRHVLLVFDFLCLGNGMG